MGKIATELDVYNVGKKGVPNQYKCCVKEKVDDFGCTLTSSRNASLCVMEGTYKKTISDVTITATTLATVSENKLMWYVRVKTSEPVKTKVTINTYVWLRNQSAGFDYTGTNGTHKLNVGETTLDSPIIGDTNVSETHMQYLVRIDSISPTSYGDQNYIKG